MNDMKVTTIQLKPETRDRMYKLKFRKTYDSFIVELCDLYDKQNKKRDDK